jgi:spermidine synthase
MANMLERALPIEQDVHYRHYAGIFVLACATLAYQILITRFFSVMLLYHYAFAGISLAMLGLTHGAITVHQNKSRYAAGRVNVEFARHASYFAISSVVVMIVFLGAPLLVPAAYAAQVLLFMIALFFFPFAQSGICISLLLTRLPGSSGRLYAADLVGAATGCILIIGILFLIDPVSATLCVAAAVAGAGWYCARAGNDAGIQRLSAGVALIIASLAALHIGLYLSGLNHVGVVWAKGRLQTETLFERWNTFSRVRVRPFAGNKPFGWGMVRDPEATVEQKYLDIDADAGTVITRMDGDVGKFTYLQTDVINAAYLVQPIQSVAVIGVGGGRDILSALYFGAERITGIEINPAIFEVLTDKFADFSGHLDKQPGVSLINAEARSYINHSQDKYDLIQISLIDTWAATAAGGLTLTENRLYTVEAWADFFRALNPGGLLSISRWYDSDTHRAEFYRLIAIAAKTLTNQGVAAAELPQHVVALKAKNIVTVIARPTALPAAQWERARKALEAEGFEIMLGRIPPSIT